MNMSYCMFENTVNDLRQCRSQLMDEGTERTTAQAGERERSHVMGLIKLCQQIVDEFDKGEYGDDEDPDINDLEIP